MATLYVEEFTDMPKSYSSGPMQVAKWPPCIRSNNVAIGGASAASQPFNFRTAYIRVHPDAICSIFIGINPVATTNDARMIAGQTEYWGVFPGDQIAVISNV